MMKLRDLEFDFDISCPEDLERYLRCSEEMERRTADAPSMPTDMTYPHGLRAYTDWMTAYVKRSRTGSTASSETVPATNCSAPRPAFPT